MSKFAIVDINQLKLLTRHCYVCGYRIHDEGVQYSTKFGIVFIKYWCGSCSTRRYWKSYEHSYSSIMAGASLLSDIKFSKILNFFTLLQCAFPSRSAIYSSAKNIVHPVIQKYYKNDQLNILNKLIQSNIPVNLCIGTYYSTVAALESSTNKIISFVTACRSETDNFVCNNKLLDFKQVFDDITSKKLEIASVTTDNNEEIDDFFSKNYPNICHFIDLYHILREMYHNFSPKFNKSNSNLKRLFILFIKHIWDYKDFRNNSKNKTLMLERYLSTLLHLAGVHKWKQGRFVDIFHQNVGPHNFHDGYIQNIFIKHHLSCDHDINSSYETMNNNFHELKILVDDLCTDIRLHQFERAAQIVSIFPFESFNFITSDFQLKKYLLLVFFLIIFIYYLF